MQLFRLALVFLTRIPFKLSDQTAQAPVARAVVYFPLVGSVVGVVMASLWAFAGALWPPLVAALLAVSAGVLLTGALHEDAVADVADGFGGGRDKDHCLAIMKDSRIGAYGVVALVLTLGLKVGLFMSLEASVTGFCAIVAAAMVSRGLMAWLWSDLPNARGDGVAAAAGQPDKGTAGLGLCLAALPALVVLPAQGAALGLLLAGLVLLLLKSKALKKIGGQTGDVLGAAQILTELAFLLGCSALL